MRMIAIPFLLLSLTANAAPQIPAFSQMRVEDGVTGWQPLRPAPNAVDTRYALSWDGGTVVLKADAIHSMSGLIYPVRVKLAQFPLLRWRWKIAAPVQRADMTQKTGDDYAARIYVMFDYPEDKLPFAVRMKLRFASRVFGQKLPTAALNYVWDNRAAIGTLQANVYTERARMLVLQSGASKAGLWVEETRDLAADFRRAFGEDAPDVVAIALATDTDNTGEVASAWYGDIQFLPAGTVDVR
jgi:hypothetical protein